MQRQSIRLRIAAIGLARLRAPATGAALHRLRMQRRRAVPGRAARYAKRWPICSSTATRCKLPKKIAYTGDRYAKGGVTFWVRGNGRVTIKRAGKISECFSITAR